VSTYGDINQRTAAWAAAEMLSHAAPVEVLAKYGLTKPIPRNKANGASFRRANILPPALTPLTEGVQPTPGNITYTDVPVTLDQYGHVVSITDHVADMAEDPVLKDAAMLCGEQAAETIEILLWNVLRAGTSVDYANGALRTAVNTPITLGLQRAATRALKAARAKPITKMLSASPMTATEPVSDAYIGFGHTDLEADIRDMTGFLPAEKYSVTKPMPYEIGKVEGVRYILTPVVTKFEDAGGAAGSMVSTSGTSADVYPVVIIGREAYGLTPLRGDQAIKPHVLQPDTPSKSDALGQVGYVGWKTYFAAARLNELWMTRLEVACTGL